jgi:hypothetical protein
MKSMCGQPSDYSCCQYNVQGLLKCKKGSCNPGQAVLPNEYPHREEMHIEKFSSHHQSHHDKTNEDFQPEAYEEMSSHATFESN